MYEPKQIYTRIVPATDTHFGVPFADSFIISTMLLHLDGPDGSNDIYDATNRHVVGSTSGTTTLSNVWSKFGPTSARFNGTSGFRLFVDTTSGSNADLALGLNDFTVDFWINLDAINVAQSLIDFAGVNGGNPLIYIGADNTLRFSIDNGGTDSIASVETVAVGIPYHVAAVRFGGLTRLFLGGSQVGNTYVDTNNYTIGTFGPLVARTVIGLDIQFAGFIDEVRIVNGTAMWTGGGFTPPSRAYLPP